MTTPAAGQGLAVNGKESRQAFESQLASLRSRISADEKALSQTRSEESATLQLLNRLNRDIAIRERVVDTFEQRIKELSAERDSVFAQVERLSSEIVALKEEYRARATHAYKYGRLHDLALIFSAASIN
ncbi:MAG: peptidase M23, partial [Gemmatimonadetes bacterium]|nr:peptidase M23 [Gemmatimonadota bacterium]